MHSVKLILYCGLWAEEKKTVLGICSSSDSQATIHAFVGLCVLPLGAPIDQDIVDTIFGYMMFQSEDMNGTSRDCLFSSYAPTLDPSENADDTGGISWYVIIVKSSKQYPKVSQYLDAEMSFRKVAQLMLKKKELLGNWSIESIFEAIVGHYARLICAMNLQGIVKLL